MDRLLSEGEYIHQSCSNVQKTEMERIVSEFLKTIDSEEEIFIFGAGNVARRLCKELGKNEKLGIIKAFIVSDQKDNPSEIDGIPIEEYVNYIDAPEKIVIGVWDTRQEEIYSELVKCGIRERRIMRVPFPVNEALEFLYREPDNWKGSKEYWNDRYEYGGNSGAGSYGRLAEFKAEILNEFMRKHDINSVIEWGCGDGNQVSLVNYAEYTGYDVSKKAIEICRKKYEMDKRKRFIWCGGEDFQNESKADLALSLDVIYHLVEDVTYRVYMDRLFQSSRNYVCIYSSNFDKRIANHVRCRKFTDYVENNFKEWKLIEYYPNRYPYKEQNSEGASWSDFFFYQKML